MRIPAYKLSPQEVLRVRHCWQNWGLSVRRLSNLLAMSEEKVSKMVHRTTHQMVERSDYRYFDNQDAAMKWLERLSVELREGDRSKVRGEWKEWMEDLAKKNDAQAQLERELWFENNREMME